MYVGVMAKPKVKKRGILLYKRRVDESDCNVILNGGLVYFRPQNMAAKIWYPGVGHMKEKIFYWMKALH